ncbi:MAG TPA: hypothetical protein VH143_03765 [Kofleriaceae bacterium]|jgi:hypothetical protein|nr:hypothetical protein [Kofleriaceae bacterium]
MSDPCAAIKSQITELQTELAAASAAEQRQLSGPDAPAGSGKGQEIDHITQPSRDLAARITALETRYDECRYQHGGEPDLVQKAAGAKAHISVNNGTPLVEDVAFTTTFDRYHHTTWSIDHVKFPSVTVSGFKVDVTVTSNSGTYVSDPTSHDHGELTLSMKVHLNIHGLDDADVTIVLAGKLALTGTHSVTLVGKSHLKESGLSINPVDGDPMTLTLSFTLAKLP